MLKKASRLPISWIVGGQNLLILACMSAAFLVFLFGLREIKVNGPYYTHIKDSADLISDVLPPPLYAIETYLTVHQLALTADKDEIAVLENKLGSLRRDFDQRTAYWNSRNLPDDVRKLLIEESSPSARKMFAVIDVKFLPAVKAGNKEQIALSLGEIRDLYDQHRTAVDRLVIAANQSLENAAADAAVTEASTMNYIYGFMALAVMAALAGLALLFATNVRPMQKIMDSLRTLSGGNGDIYLGDTDGKGEIPRMWQAVAKLRTSVLEALRLKQIIDEMPSNVMVADPQSGVVNYVNNATLKTLIHQEDGDAAIAVEDIPVLDIQQTSANALIARKTASNWHTRIKVGSDTLSLRVDAILGTDGRYLAPMLTWEISTATQSPSTLNQKAKEPLPESADHYETATPDSSRKLNKLTQSISTIARQSHLLALKASLQEGFVHQDKAKTLELLQTSQDLLENLNDFLRRQTT